MTTEQLKSIQGQPLSYSKLCRALGMENKGSSVSSKKSQLSKLSDLCNIKILRNPTRYIITEVYDEDMLDIIKFLNAPRQQILFNIALHKQIISNGSGLLFCSNTQLLKLLGEVNENFSYTFNSDNPLALGDEYFYMQAMSKTVYNILMQWTRRKICNMGFAIIATPAFRLYTDTYTPQGTVVQYVNVSFGSSLYSRCQRVMDIAINEIITDPKYLILDEKTNQRIGLAWMPEGMWYALEAKVNHLVRDEFQNEGFTRLNNITAFSSASGDIIQKRLDQSMEMIKDITEINETAQKKIMATTQLDKFTDEERERYIEYNINPKPPKLFREELKKMRKKEGS